MVHFVGLWVSSSCHSGLVSHEWVLVLGESLQMVFLGVLVVDLVEAEVGGPELGCVSDVLVALAEEVVEVVVLVGVLLVRLVGHVADRLEK